MNATSMHRGGFQPASLHSRTPLISGAARPVLPMGMSTSRRCILVASSSTGSQYPIPGNSGPGISQQPISHPPATPRDPPTPTYKGSGGGGSGGVGGNGGGGSGGAGGSGDWQEKLPPPPSGFSWTQLLTWAAVIAAIFVSPLPRWIQENVFKKEKSVEQVAKDNYEWTKKNAEKTGDKVKHNAKDAARKVEEAAKDAAEKTRNAAVNNVYTPAKEGTESLVHKAEHVGQDAVQAVKGAASSVGRTLHVLPDRAKEGADKLTKEGDKALKKASKEVKKKANQLDGTSEHDKKQWLVYSGVGLALVAAGAVVAEEVVRRKKNTPGGDNKPAKKVNTKPNTSAKPATIATTTKDPVVATTTVRPATTTTTPSAPHA